MVTATPFANRSTPAGAAGSPWLIWLPAYLALGLAMASTLNCLSTTLISSGFSLDLWLGLAAGLLVSYSVRCGGRTTREIFVWLLVMLSVLTPPALVMLHSVSIMPKAVYSDGNVLVAAWLGCLVVGTVFFAGISFGRTTVPLTAPLVPALSLFGLMNIMSLNASANEMFLIFVGSSLYLAAYERMVRSRLKATDGTAAPLHLRSLASQAVWACAIWLAAFALGASAFFYPVTALLPTNLTAELAKAPLPLQKSGDWRTSPPVIELKGGDYLLSNRSVARITVDDGRPSGLFRADVYSRYTGSRWHEAAEIGTHSIYTHSGSETSVTVRGQGYTFSISGERPSRVHNYNISSCDDKTCRTVVESVVPYDSSTGNLISSGQPEAISGDLGEVQVRGDGTSTVVDSLHRAENYTIRSQVLAPNPTLLDAAPGLTNDERNAWLSDGSRIDTLFPPDAPNSALQLRRIAIDILKRAHALHLRYDTPARKVDVITAYITGRCLYSLEAPAVPDGTDAVLFFLQHSRRGACDMFASSTVLLLRTMGVPARLTSGYLQPDTADTADGRTFTLRERDAHAWVEYFVPRFGWVAYDPTAHSRMANAHEEGFYGLNLENIGAFLTRYFWPISAAMLALVALAFFGGRKKNQRQASRPAGDLPQAQVKKVYLRARAMLGRRIVDAAHYTPHEYEQMVDGSALPAAVKLEFAALTYLFVQAQYDELDPRLDSALCTLSLARLRGALRNAKAGDRQPSNATWPG